MPNGVFGGIPPLNLKVNRDEVAVKAGDVLDVQIDKSCFLCTGISAVILIIGAIIFFFLYEYLLN